MAKKKREAKGKGRPSGGRIGLRTGEALVEADEAWSAAEPEVLFRTNREATAKALGKAMRHEPTIDWLLANQTKVSHYFHQLAVDGQLE